MTDINFPAPNFDRERIAALLLEHWGLTGALSPLESERDQNHRLDAEDGTRWTVKVVNASEPELETGFQTALLQHLAVSSPELPMPRLRLTKDGDAIQSVVGLDGARHAMRVVSWVDGVPLAEMRGKRVLLVVWVPCLARWTGHCAALYIQGHCGVLNGIFALQGRRGRVLVQLLTLISCEFWSTFSTDLTGWLRRSLPG